MITPSSRAVEPSPEALECFRWFASLDFPDVRRATFASFTDGRWWRGGFQGGAGQEKNYGFILKDGRNVFTVLTAEWEILRLKKSGTGDGDVDRIEWKEAGFEDYCKELAAKLRRRKVKPDSLWDRFGERLSHPAEIFGVAFAAWRRGSPEAAGKLFGEAVRVWRGEFLQRGRAATFRGQLELDLGYAAMWRAVVAFSGGDWERVRHLVSRRELRNMLEAVVRQFPASPYATQAGEMAAVLGRMVAEDEAHAVRTEEMLESLPVEERVQELIFRLRNQNGRQNGQPGACDIFAFQKTGDTPAHHLRGMGLEAVPGLIGALGDKRFTRSVWFHRDSYFSHRVLTIGDCALTILQCIAGQGFYVAGEMSREERLEARHAAVKAWWKSVRQKGLKQSLVEEISSGEIDPGPLCYQLEEMDEDAVMPALLAGAARAAAAWMKGQFYHCMARSSDPRGGVFVRERIKKEKNAAARLMAVTALMPVNREEALAAVFKDWRRDVPEDEVEESIFVRGRFAEMAELLTQSGAPEGIEALEWKWKRRTANQRAIICKVLARSTRRFPLCDEGMGNLAGVVKAAEKVLMRALHDTDVRTSMGGSFDDWSFCNPSIATMAHWALNQILPEVYSFTKRAFSRQRESERIAAINSWRKVHGKRLLPMPAKREKLPSKGALTIVETVSEPPGTEDLEFAREWLRVLKGRKLKAATLPDICRQFITMGVEGVAGLAVEAERDDDLTGVTVTLRVKPGDSPNRQGGWSRRWRIVLGTKVLLEEPGWWFQRHAEERAHWARALAELQKVVAAPPETPFGIQFDVGAAG